MQQAIEQMSSQITEKWGNLSKSQKIRLVSAIGGFLAIILVIGLIVTKPKMAVVYRNLSLEDASSATAVLEEQEIPYEVIDNGTTIQVDQKHLTKAKFALSGEGIPKGRYSFDDALNNTMYTTEDEKTAKMHKYKETELEEDLISMTGIKDARVTLVIPEEKNAFIQSTKESSAGVILTLTQEMNAKQIDAIARFVANSVENLDTKNVEIIDADGNKLYIGDDETHFATSKQQELKSAAEIDIKNKVTDLLEPIYDEIRISPNLILDFNQYEEVREEYNSPIEGDNKGLIDYESRVDSESRNTPAGGEPGTATNGGDATEYVIGGGTNSSSETSQRETDYLHDKVVSNKIKNQGDILYEKSSLAVNVFKHKIYKQEMIEKTLEEGMTWESFKIQNKDNKVIPVDEQVLEIIRNGSGVENVVVTAFEKPIFIDTEPYVIDFKDYIPYALILLGLMITILAVIKFKKHDKVVETEPELEVEELLHATKQEVELDEIEVKENLETKRQIEKFVDEKPEAVANLLRNWLNEDDWN